MGYAVKELFYTLQGEGRNAGRAAVFCRFTGCNLWSGRENRASAACTFCDTDFVGTDGPGGGRFEDARSLADAARATWRGQDGEGRKLIVLTGGEPLLQVDETLTAALHDAGFEIAVETNGTQPLPGGVDWVCVSPKAATALVVTSGQELKLVHPQLGVDPSRFEHLAFDSFLLQPLDGPDRVAATEACVAYCMLHPQWRLSIQTHKSIGIR